MTHTIGAVRKNIITTVGVEITDTHLYFIELEPQLAAEYELLLPRSYGTVGITFDAVDGGRVLNKARVLESIKKLRQQTKSTVAVLSSWNNQNIDEQWQELFNVAGFEKTLSLNAAIVLSARLSSNSTITHFEDNNTVNLISSGKVIDSHNYPLDVNGILALQDAVELEDTIMYISGHIPNQAADEDMPSTFADYGIRASLFNIWNGCFSFTQHIPSMHRKDTSDYAVAASLAYCISWNNPEKLSKNNTANMQSVTALPVTTDAQNKTLQDRWSPIKKEAVDKEITAQSHMVAPKTDTSEKITLQQKFLPRNKKLQKQVLKKPVVQKLSSLAEASLDSKPQSIMDTLIQVLPSEKSESVWSKDADDIIYSLFRKSEKK